MKRDLRLQLLDDVLLDVRPAEDPSAWVADKESGDAWNSYGDRSTPLAAVQSRCADPWRTGLAVARRRRRRESLGRSLATAAMALVGLIAVWMQLRPIPQAEAPPVHQTAVSILVTRPLFAGMRAHTSAARAVPYVRSYEAIEVVANRPEPELFQPIDDEQLVMLAGVPAVVVHIGDEKAELVTFGNLP